MRLALFALLAIAACAQTVPTASSVTTAQLPAYVAAGGAYNQFAGANLWASGILPVSNSLGLYESTTADIFPVRATIGTKTGYIFTTSVRQGVHKVLHQDPKNMILFGADAGVVLPSSGAVGLSLSGAVTFTYVRQLTSSLAFMIPVRALYIGTLGGWNPIAEIGIVWKPGSAK